MSLPSAEVPKELMPLFPAKRLAGNSNPNVGDVQRVGICREVGRGFCGVRPRIFREAGVSDFCDAHVAERRAVGTS
jgi:hypothetical protein